MRKLLLLITFLSAVSISAKTINVVPAQAGQLQDIVNKSKPGDIIVLASGNYYLENGIYINKKTNLSIEGKKGAHIEVSKEWTDVFTVSSSRNIHIAGISAKHKNPPKGYVCAGAVIAVFSSNRVVIDNVNLNGSGAVGLSLHNSKDVTIMNSYLHHNNEAAFYLRGKNSLTVKNIKHDNNGSFLDSDGNSKIRIK